jgi:hypothetical protein
MDNTLRKQTQITQITQTRHQPSYKQHRGKDEPNMVFMRTSQHGTQNVKTHNKTTQKAKKMSYTDPTKITGGELRCHVIVIH